MRQGEDCSGVSQAQRDDLRRRDCVGAAASGASIVLAGAIRRRSAVPVARDAARSGYTSSLMAAVLAVAATVTSVIPASADNRNVPQFPTAWQSKLDTSHPLVGRIWSRAANGFVSAQDYGTALAKSRFILLGEVHDNPDHHALQAWAIRTVSKLRGARLVEGAPQADIVALEMLTSDQNDDLDRFYGRKAKVPRPRTADDFGRMLKWDRLGWPDYAIYAPIIAQALYDQLVLKPASPPRTENRAVSKDGFDALGEGVASALALDRPLPAAAAEGLAVEIRDGHCNMMPETGIPAMSRVQRLRDARMADAMMSVGEWKGGFLIAGNGHVRRDRGVAWYMAARGIPEAEITTVLHVEVRDGMTDPAAYMDPQPPTATFADFIVFTPRTQRPDACEEMRRQMQQMQRKS